MQENNPALPLQAADLEMLHVNIPRNLECYRSRSEKSKNVEAEPL